VRGTRPHQDQEQRQHGRDTAAEMTIHHHGRPRVPSPRRARPGWGTHELVAISYQSHTCRIDSNRASGWLGAGLRRPRHEPSPDSPRPRGGRGLPSWVLSCWVGQPP
jgi:hypothetical protein